MSIKVDIKSGLILVFCIITSFASNLENSEKIIKVQDPPPCQKSENIKTLFNYCLSFCSTSNDCTFDHFISPFPTDPWS